MITLLESSINNISPSAIKAIQSKYPTAVVRVEIENVYYKGDMNDACFWAIIDVLDWKTRDSTAILAPAIKALSQFSQNDIQVFHDILNEKLYALDGRRYAEQLGSNRYTTDSNNPFSVDNFLYARCCVVANGKGFYQKVLENPAKMPKEYTFESLLYLPRKAWQLKTGQDNYAYFPEVWSETFSNPNGWEGITPMKDRILNLL